MKLNLRSILFTATVLLAASCSNEAPKKIPALPIPKLGEKVRNVSIPKVDILFVIDNSGSMGTHQANLSANINKFVSEVKNLAAMDYRIGVTTSTFTGGSISPGVNGGLIGVPNYVDRNTRNGDAVLRSRLAVGTNSYTDEVLLQTISYAFSPEAMRGTNAGFYRDNAFVAVIFITDAEDQGDQSPEDVYDFLVSLKDGKKSRVLSYGAIIPTNSTTGCTRDSWNTPVLIERFIELTDGQYFDLCDVDYGTKLAEVAEDLAKRVVGTIILSRRPKVETIEVNYGTQKIPPDLLKGWAYNPALNAIVFGPELEFEEQPEGTEMSVDFEPIPIEDRQ
jgi:hypothetical protein